MSRAEVEGIVLDERLDIGAVELVARQDGELAVDPEQCDRQHEDMSCHSGKWEPFKGKLD